MARHQVVDPTFKKNVYLNRDGESISLQQWRSLRAMKEYSCIREFENDKLYVAVLWLGEVPDAKTVPPEHWKLYGVTVMNIRKYDADGVKFEDGPRRTTDPELAQRFRTEQEAIDHYEDVLVRYAGCEWLQSEVEKGGHRFIERGNKLAPPPPDAPNTRLLEEAGLDPALAGSW
jgi:hypothetical protein